MAIVREQGATNFSTADVASLAVTLPGAATNGNLLIGSCGRRIVSAVGSIGAPSGFTEKVQSAAPSATANRTQISYKVVSGDGTGPFTFTAVSQNQEMVASVVEWSGMDTSSFTGGTNSSLNESPTVETTTSIAVTTTGTNSLLIFAMTHSDNAAAFSGLAYTNSFVADIAQVVMVDANDVNHHTATKIVSSASSQACVASWTDPGYRSSQCLAEFFGSTSAPPVLTVPGAQAATFGTTKSIGGFSFSDADSDVNSITATCETGMTITFDLNSTGVTHGSTNGTSAVSLSGTHADLSTVIGRGIDVDHAEIFPTNTVTKTIDLTVTDAGANNDNDTVAVTWTPPTSRYKVLTGTPAAIIAALQALEWTPSSGQSGVKRFRMISTTSVPLSDTDDFTVEVLGVSPVVTVPSTQQAQYDVTKAISGILVSHVEGLTTSLRLQCPAAVTMTVDAGSTGATLTGNISSNVLIEDDNEADLSAVAETLTVDRAHLVPPVPSSLVPFSANTYSVESNLQVSNVVYSDRAYVFTDIPTNLLGATWIKTPNDDKVQSDAATLAFNLNFPAWVYLTLDTRYLEAATFPAWMAEWEFVNDTISNDSGTGIDYFLYRQSFPAGTVTLGGYDFGTLYSHYTVIILPIAATIPITVTATDSNGNTDVDSFTVAWSATGNQIPIYLRRRRRLS